MDLSHLSPVEITDRVRMASLVMGAECPAYNLAKECLGRGIFITGIDVKHPNAAIQRHIFYFDLSDGRRIRQKIVTSDPVRKAFCKRFIRFVCRGE